MQRRAILSTAALAALAGVPSVQPAKAAADGPAPGSGWRRFEITTSITLLDSPGPAQLWIPVAQTAAGYQSALGLQWRGTGRTELVRLIAGLDRPSRGTIRIKGRAVTFRTPREAIRAGVSLLPEDRKRRASSRSVRSRPTWHCPGWAASRALA